MQPCDAVHQKFRVLTDHYEDVGFGFNSNPLTRQGVEEILCNEIGYAPRDYKDLEHIVKSSLWAWENMPDTLMRWAWTSRGFCSEQEMAAMNSLPLDKIQQDEDSVKELQRKLEALDDIPPVAETVEDPILRAVAKTLLPLPKKWYVAVRPTTLKNMLQDYEWEPLPKWMRESLDRELLNHYESLRSLTFEKIAAHHSQKTLPAKKLEELKKVEAKKYVELSCCCLTITNSWHMLCMFACPQELFYHRLQEREIKNKKDISKLKAQSQYWLTKKATMTIELYFDGPKISIAREPTRFIKCHKADCEDDCLETVQPPKSLSGIHKYNSDHEESDAESSAAASADGANDELLEKWGPAQEYDGFAEPDDTDEGEWELQEIPEGDGAPLASASLTTCTTAGKGENLRYTWHGHKLNELYSTGGDTRTLIGLSIICGCHHDSTGYECARSISFGANHVPEDACETALKRWLVRGCSLADNDGSRAKHMERKGSNTTRALLNQPLTPDEKTAAVNCGRFQADALEGL